jgi:hypothetical protein
MPIYQTKSGRTYDVVDESRLVPMLKIFKLTMNDGMNTSFDLTHNLMIQDNMYNHVRTIYTSDSPTFKQYVKDAEKHSSQTYEAYRQSYM